MSSARRRLPGLASERTALAWVRSLTGLAGVSLLLSRGLLMRWPLLPAGLAIAATVLLLLGACLLGERRRRALLASRPGPPHPGMITALTVGAVLVAALGGVVLLH